jgi:micrococcal nuclease
MRGPLLLLAIAALVLSRCGDGGEEGGSTDAQRSTGATVTDVVDGDTIEVELGDGSNEDVRYIGIDTPESVKPDTPVQCAAHKASTVNERLVGGRQVTLRFDAERRDAYGRLLAYVYVPGAGAKGRPLFVNAELVRRGLARTLTISPNDSFAPLFARLQAAASRAGRGLWGACPL